MPELNFRSKYTRRGIASDQNSTETVAQNISGQDVKHCRIKSRGKP